MEVLFILGQHPAMNLRNYTEREATQKQRPYAALHVGVHVSSLQSLIQLSVTEDGDQMTQCDQARGFIQR